MIINSHKIRSLGTNLVSKVNKQKKGLERYILKKFRFLFLSNLFSIFIFLLFLKVRHLGRKSSSFRTVRILKICLTSRPDVMSGRPLNRSMALLFRRPFCETGDILIESAATAEMKVHFGDLIFQVLESWIHPFIASSRI